jgi:Tetratricopeptide repeat
VDLSRRTKECLGLSIRIRFGREAAWPMLLDEKGKYAEEEAESRDVIKHQEKILGPEHPSTLRSCYYFASGLKHQNKLQAAKEFARRVAEGARKVLGPDHPSTKE